MNMDYLKIIDQDIKNLIHNNDNHPQVLSKIEKNVLNVLMSNDIPKILNNAREWFERNCLPENQINLMLSYLEDFRIFEGEGIKIEETQIVETNNFETLNKIELMLQSIITEINELKTKI